MEFKKKDETGDIEDDDEKGYPDKGGRCVKELADRAIGMRMKKMLRRVHHRSHQGTDQSGQEYREKPFSRCMRLLHPDPFFFHFNAVFRTADGQYKNNCKENQTKYGGLKRPDGPQRGRRILLFRNGIPDEPAGTVR
ncbi:hypothetical protein JW906_09040 [bacterium]|nr:hypothetical protein [bacterium]